MCKRWLTMTINKIVLTAWMATIGTRPAVATGPWTEDAGLLACGQ